MTQHPQLGQRIRELVNTVRAHRRHQGVAAVPYLAEYLDVSIKTIYAWQEGRNVPRQDALIKLVRFGATQAGMQRRWAYDVLRWASYPRWADLLATLYPEPPDTLRHNLPRHAPPLLIGRDAELAQLEQWWQHHHSRPLVIEGLGGSGKSALALESAWRYLAHTARQAPPHPAAAIIWVTFQSALLTARGIGALPFPNTELADVYRILARVLDVERKATSSPATQYRDILAALRKLERAVLILDAIAGLDFPTLRGFLNTLPANIRVLLTSRQHLGLPHSLSLTPLAPPDAVALVQLESARRDYGARHPQPLTTEDVQALSSGTYGLPLALRWALDRMDVYGETVAATLRHLHDPQADVLSFLFRSLRTRLQAEEASAYQVWTALTTFAPDISVPVTKVAARAGLPSEDTQSGLQRLVNHYLGHWTPEGHFGLHPLAHAFLHPVHDEEANFASP